MDPRERFTKTVENYTRYRPDYPDAVFDWLARLGSADGAERCGRAIDLGAGTGIFSRALAARGWSVTGVEPNAAMRAAAAEASALVPIVAGTAEATGLPDASADLIVGAQAFHWFDLDLALPEIDRLAAPGAYAAAVWNIRSQLPFNRAYAALIADHVPPDDAPPLPEPTLANLRSRRPGGTDARFPHHHTSIAPPCTAAPGPAAPSPTTSPTPPHSTPPSTPPSTPTPRTATSPSATTP